MAEFSHEYWPELLDDDQKTGGPLVSEVMELQSVSLNYGSKKIIHSPRPTLNNSKWWNSRFRLPEYIAVLRIQISHVVNPGNQKVIFFERG